MSNAQRVAEFRVVSRLGAAKALVGGVWSRAALDGPGPHAARRELGVVRCGKEALDAPAG